MERRENTRAIVRRNGYVVHYDGRTELGKILDISDHGAGIKLADPKKRGEKFQLAFRLPLGPNFDEYIIDCIVEHCHLKDDIFHVGVMFKLKDEEQKKSIAKYIKSKKP